MRQYRMVKQLKQHIKIVIFHVGAENKILLIDM